MSGMRGFLKSRLVWEYRDRRELEDISDSGEGEEERRPVAPRHHYIIKPIKIAPKRPPRELFEVIALDVETVPEPIKEPILGPSE